MTITKREYESSDGAIAVLYAKRDGNQTISYPVIVNPDGSLSVNITAGTISAKGIYNATPPTLTDGQQEQLQLTSDGDLKTEIQNPSIEQTTGAAHNTLNVAVAGKDNAGNVQPLATDTSGNLQVDILGSALPSGAATETTLAAVKTATELLATLVYTIQELLYRMDTIAACKYHLLESLRTTVVGTATISGNVIDATTNTTYVAPGYAKWIENQYMGNTLATLANINNVTGA